jgi:hypothetical protein
MIESAEIGHLWKIFLVTLSGSVSIWKKATKNTKKHKGHEVILLTFAVLKNWRVVRVVEGVPMHREKVYTLQKGIKGLNPSKLESCPSG